MFAVNVVFKYSHRLEHFLKIVSLEVKSTI